MMATQTPQVPDAKLLAKLKRCLWRDQARRAGVAEADIERSVFCRWRLERREKAQPDGLGRNVTHEED